MKLFDIYNWAIGSKASFLNSFQNEEELYAQAQQFWNGLESNAFIFAGIFLVMGAVWAWTYYGRYNNKPGRHYHPKHWVLLLALCAVLTFCLTLGAAYLYEAPKLNGAWPLEIKLSLANTLYALIIYILGSVIYCNYLPTNAYRLFRF